MNPLNNKQLCYKKNEIKNIGIEAHYDTLYYIYCIVQYFLQYVYLFSFDFKVVF